MGTDPDVAVLGIDIGGSLVKAGLAEPFDGTLVEGPLEEETPRPATVDAIVHVVGRLADKLDGAGTVGCTFPGRVRDGVVTTAVNLDDGWLGVTATDVIGERLGRPVRMLNDADAAGLAEVTFGAGRGRTGTVLMVTMGTGIGTSLFFDGRLVVPNLELGEIELHGADAADCVGKAARERLPDEAWCAEVALLLYRLGRMVDPDLVIVGGGLAEHIDLDDIAVAQGLSFDVARAALGNCAGIIGAALFSEL